jgi:multidrug resistance efflux pump
LILSQQRAGEQVVFVVKDPVTERFFRFREIEGFILEHLDGKTPLDLLRMAMDEHFGSAPSLETLERFIGRLKNLGLIESSETESAAAARPNRRIRGNPLYLRFRIFNPDRLLDRLVGRLRFLFTPSFFVFSAAVILVAAGMTASQWNEILQDFPRLYSFQSLFLAYVTMLTVITAHEFAHGLTCKHHGGSVREMGFFLLFFQPAFYCNVSDAWLFPEKSKRLWVTFAGAYFEIFLWAIATVVWRLSDPFTLINYMALVVMATSGIKTLFNLNPLIKLDGYYLLSDLLGVPNLRQRAFGWLGDRFRSVWGSAVRHIKDATPRERWIYLIYGALAWVYSFWLLKLILSGVGGYLTARYQGWGVVIFAAFFIGLFQHSIKKLLRRPLAFITFRPGMNLWLKRGIRLAVLVAIAAALFLVRAELRISGPFVVLPVHNADVRAEVEGIIQQVVVGESDVVNKGDLIVTLADRDFRAELVKIRAEIEEKKARLNLLKAGTRPEEIELARTLIAKGDERLKYANARLVMDATLYQDKLISKRDLEDSKEQVAMREKEIQEATDKLKVLLAGSRKEEIEATAAEVNRLQAQQHHLEEQLGLLKVVSPIAGVITTHKLKDKIGEAVKKGDLIAKVHEMKTVTVEIAVPEKEIADVTIGQKVVLKAQAYPQRSFEGTVTAIAPIATSPDDPRGETTVRVITQLDNAARLLKPDMTGHAKIYCGEQRLIELMGRRLVRFFKVEFWSWW